MINQDSTLVFDMKQLDHFETVQASILYKYLFNWYLAMVSKEINI